MSFDRRARMTRKMLNEAMIRLLEEKPISRITVTELCQAADVNRSTYYRHFSDPQNQAESICDEFLAGVLEFIVENESGKAKSDEASVSEIVQYIFDNRKVFIAMVSCFGFRGYEERMYQAIGEATFSSWISRGSAVNDRNKKFALTYTLGGGMATLLDWVSDENSTYTVSEMTDFLQKSNFYLSQHHG